MRNRVIRRRWGGREEGISLVEPFSFVDFPEGGIACVAEEGRAVCAFEVRAFECDGVGAVCAAGGGGDERFAFYENRKGDAGKEGAVFGSLTAYSVGWEEGLVC